MCGSLYMKEFLLTSYLAQIGRYSVLSHDEEITLAKEIKKGSSEAKLTLINCNLRLVVSIAEKYADDEYNLMDLIQEGNLGLITAAGKFNPKFNCRFSTYAFPWITQYILRYIQNKMPVIRLPHKKEEKIIAYLKEFGKQHQLKTKVDEAGNVLMKKAASPGKENLQTVIFYLDMGESELKKILECDYSCISMHTPIEGMDGVTGEDMLADERYSLENTSMKVFVQNEIQSLLHTLSERERQVLYYRYDMGDSKNNPRTFRQISKILGCSAETVRKIELHALKSLRSVAKEKLSI